MENFNYETFINEVTNHHNKEVEEHKTVIDLIQLARDHYVSKIPEDARDNPKFPLCLYVSYYSCLENLRMKLSDEMDINRAIRGIEEMERILKAIEKCKRE